MQKFSTFKHVFVDGTDSKRPVPERPVPERPVPERPQTYKALYA